MPGGGGGGYGARVELEAEFTSEPFRGEGTPPEHAVRAKDAAERAGLAVDFGPLGTTVQGEADAVLDALPAIARAALAGGATRFTLRLGAPDGEPPVTPVGARRGSVLDRLIRQVEAELGAPLAELDRPGKQRAVRLLDERGAFQLRKSVAAVAEALGVTRFTVYNYLNRGAAG
ncbi:HTH domain-containing protein [Amycolatopsis arida]|uniref:HTH domain-containing protein n=1 Tax=Amycolatopsis arida TaxID=587909 RepID=A0A1I5KG40_9PSEU|nr:HTH domain-containing protein [Amycolatopsis arida]SFO84002.1 HTH domain-containing protein [Amycolatopsis arida]